MPRAENGIKICNKCKCAKPVIDFHKDKNRIDGLMQICITCKREYRISPFYKAREKELEKTQEYRNRKKTYFRTQNGKFQKSKEHHKYKTDLDLKLQHDLTFKEWDCIVINQNNKCAICNTSFGYDCNPERDCIVPLSKGGYLTFNNTQALCKHCNSAKGTIVYSGLGNRWRLNFKK